MLAQSLDRLLREVPADAQVLDIGGWAKPLPRADWVIDLMPYETRGLYGRESEEPERFTEATWVRHDICAREPFPFDDDRFDFVVCSHTLEDIRDPVWVCSEIARIGRAGYIETPSRLEEQSFGVHGPWVGWSHHHWMVELVGPDHIEFFFKYHVIHSRDHFPAEFHQSLSPEERVVQLWWTGSFRATERFYGTGEAIDADLRDFVVRELDARGLGTDPTRTRRRLFSRR